MNLSLLVGKVASSRIGSGTGAASAQVQLIRFSLKVLASILKLSSVPPFCHCVCVQVCLTAVEESSALSFPTMLSR